MCVFVLCVFSSVEGGKRIKGGRSLFFQSFSFLLLLVLLVHALFILSTCLCVLDEPIHKAAKKKEIKNDGETKWFVYIVDD